MDKYGPIHYYPPIGPEPPISIQLFGINYCLPTYRNVRKSSPLTVIAYVLSGQGKVKVNTKTYRPKQGDVFILRRGSYHEVTADPAQSEPWTYIWYNINSNEVLKILELYGLLSTVHVPDAPLGRYFHQGIEWAERTDVEEMQNELQVIFMQIIVRLSQIQQKRQGKNLPLPVQQMKEYLDNRVLKPFNSEQLAKEMGMGIKQLNRNFKKEMGTTVYNYVLGKKIESAKMMLVETNLTIDQISDRLGYSDAHYFSNLFHTKTGVRPSVFRKSFQTLNED